MGAGRNETQRPADQFTVDPRVLQFINFPALLLPAQQFVISLPATQFTRFTPSAVGPYFSRFPPPFRGGHFTRFTPTTSGPHLGHGYPTSFASAFHGIDPETYNITEWEGISEAGSCNDNKGDKGDGDEGKGNSGGNGDGDKDSDEDEDNDDEPPAKHKKKGKGCTEDHSTRNVKTWRVCFQGFSHWFNYFLFSILLQVHMVMFMKFGLEPLVEFLEAVRHGFVKDQPSKGIPHELSYSS
jgi:hypothetical protein